MLYAVSTDPKWPKTIDWFILLLCNEIFDNDIGGEFINQTVGKTVKFRHGRIMNFEATDIHRGLSFNKPHIPRISVKFLGEKNEWLGKIERLCSWFRINYSDNFFYGVVV